MSDPSNPVPLPAAGWYPDPENPSQIRYWNGQSWAAPQETVSLGQPSTPAPTVVYPAPTSDYASPPPVPYYAAPNLSPVTTTPPQQSDGFAIASLVTSCAGIAFGPLVAVVGFVLGFVARSRIKKSGRAGGGMALAGIIVGAVVTVLWVLFIVLLVLLGIAVRHAADGIGGIVDSNAATARADAVIIATTIQDCAAAGTKLPSDQAGFEACMNSSMAPSLGSDGSTMTGISIDYWLDAQPKSFCVQVTKNGSTGAWTTAGSVPTQSTCPQYDNSDTPTASLTR